MSHKVSWSWTKAEIRGRGLTLLPFLETMTSSTRAKLKSQIFVFAGGKKAIEIIS